MADAVMVVDRAGRVVATNAAYDERFGLAGAAFIPADEAGRPLPSEQSPQQLAARREVFRTEFTLAEPNGDRS